MYVLFMCQMCLQSFICYKMGKFYFYVWYFNQITGVQVELPIPLIYVPGQPWFWSYMLLFYQTCCYCFLLQTDHMYKKLRNKMVVAAIDFGTTYSGWAFQAKHQYRKDPTDIKTSKWYDTCILTLSHMQLTADNLLKYKWKIAHYEYVHLTPHCFQFYLIKKLSFINVFNNCFCIISVICCKCIEYDKGLICTVIHINTRLFEVILLIIHKLFKTRLYFRFNSKCSYISNGCLLLWNCWLQSHLVSGGQITHIDKQDIHAVMVEH